MGDSSVSEGPVRHEFIIVLWIAAKYEIIRAKLRDNHHRHVVAK